MRLAPALALAASCFSLAALAADPAPPARPPAEPRPASRYQENVRVDLVQLNFLAVDAQGRPVTDLKMSEVEIFEGRRKQEVVLLQPYYTPREGAGTAGPAPAPAGPPPAPAVLIEGAAGEAAPPKVRTGAAVSPGRWIVLFFDNATSSPATRVRALEASRTFVTTRIHPGDQVAVVLFDGKTHVLQAFTSDTGRLEAAVLEASRDSERAGADRFGAMESLLDQMETCQGAADRDGCAMRYGGSYQEERVREADSLLRALILLTRSLTPIPDIKTLVMFSEGFSRNPSSDAFDAATVALGSGVSSRMMPSPDFHIERGLEEFTQAAAAARVSLFTVNPGAGSRSGAMSARRQSPISEVSNPAQIDVFRRSEMNYRQSLMELAQATGGRASETPEVLKALQEVVDLAPGLYTVAYTPSSSGIDGGTHDVRISIKRKGVEVRTRREIPLAPLMPPLTGGLSVTPEECSPEGRRPVVVSFRLDRGRLMFEKVERKFSANFAVFIRVLAEDRSEPLHQDYRFFNITNTPEEVSKGGLPDPAFELTLIVPCRQLTLLVSVIDAAGGGRGEFSAALSP